MITRADARRVSVPTVNRRNKKRLPASRCKRRKPLYQAVSPYGNASQAKYGGYKNCIKDGILIDPATKSGVFLREIAKRLLVGLEDEIPDIQERIDHIFHKQIYGIAITEITSLLARRSVYCSKFPNGKYSVTPFDDAEGNIRFKKIQHVWRDDKCVFCGTQFQCKTFPYSGQTKSFI